MSFWDILSSVGGLLPGLGIPQEPVKNDKGDVVFPTNGLEQFLANSASPTNQFAASFIGPGTRGGLKPPPGEAPIFQYKRDAAGITDGLPPIEQGFERLWRGNRPGETGVATQFTNDLPGIAIPFSKFYGGHVSYVDVPRADLPKYLNQSGAATNAEFNLPAMIAKNARPISSK